MLAMDAAVRILYLEDDAADARLIREQLRRSDLDGAFVVVSNREAFETALSHGDFDLVLSDYHLPDFTGLEALELVRTSSPQTPFILVTGALPDEQAVELLRRGATDVVLKDRLARLAPAIERALSERIVRRLHEEVQARLGEAQGLSKLAAEAARMGIWRLDVTSGALDCSEQFLTLIGVNREDWQGTVDALEALVHPEDTENFRRFLRGDADSGRQFMELEFRILKPDDGVRWMQSRGDRLLEAGAAPTTFFGVMLDITEQKQTEQTLRDAHQRKDEFLAMLAHELRNPLAPISNGLTVLRRSTLQSPESERVHAMLGRQMNHMIRLLDDLLDVSRVTLGKIDLKRAPVALQTVVQSALEMNRALVERSGHQLHVSIRSEPIMVDADSVRLTQVLSNLLSNAVKYTKDKGQIWITVKAENERALISVRDTGVGIPEGMLVQVFDLFTQVEGSDRLGSAGLGVGLAMVRLLVELHGGSVEARSAGPGRGSEFVVSLPLAVRQSMFAETGTLASAITPFLPRRRVLVVDDNRDAADSLGMLLEVAGADARVVYNGPAALEALPTYCPQVVLLDVGMPGMDGYSVARRIREDPRYRRVALIALTGFGQEQDRLRSLSAGFDHHLTKPADLNVLERLFAKLESTVQD